MGVNDPSYTIDKLPTTSAEAIRAFDERYLLSLDAVAPSSWADVLGVFDPSAAAPETTFPLSSFGGGYKRTRQESRFRKPKEDKIDVKVEEFDDGYEAKLLDLQTKVFAYAGWQAAPKRFLLNEQRHRNKNIALLLEAGESTACWDGVNFFAANHPANTGDAGAGTFPNYRAAATPITTDTIPTLETEVTAMRGVKDVQGEKMEVNPDTLLLPTELFEKTKNKLKKDLIAEDTSLGTAAVNNPYVGVFNLVHVPELTNAVDWYLADSKLAAAFGLPPWLSSRFVPSSELGLRYWDMSNSDESRANGTVKVSSHIWYGFALLFPHAIRKIKGA